MSRETAAYLREQTRLAELQKRHLEAEHALRLSHLNHQTHLLRGQRLGQTLRISFQLLAILVAAAIGCGLVLMLYDAFTSKSVVIEPLDTPQTLSARGLTGKVVAAGLLGELDRLQGATRTSAAKRDLVNAWSNEIRLAVPEAGVSVSELSRLLKARFGHDLHIDGDLIETANGSIALTVRGDGVPTQTFTGAANALPKLTTEAAEYVYSHSEPALYAAYLSNVGRNADTVSFCQAAFAGANKEDRPYLLNYWAIGELNLGAPIGESLTLFRAALRMKPDFWVGYKTCRVACGCWVMRRGRGEPAKTCAASPADVRAGRRRRSVRIGTRSPGISAHGLLRTPPMPTPMPASERP